MSNQKVTSKNLSYSAQTPAFLQRLKAGYAADDGRNNVQHARPGKSRLKMGDGDEDDGPVMLGEDGEVVGKEEWDRMMKGPEVGSTEDERIDDDAGKADGTSQGKEEQEVNERESRQAVGVGVGAGKKRKAGKVVGGDEGEDQDRNNGNGLSKTAKKPAVVNSHTKDENDKKANSNPKSKKKAKKIKLSFDDPE